MGGDTLEFIFAALLVLGHLVVLWGYGALLTHWRGPSEMCRGLAFTSVAGIPVLLTIGGVLNVLGLATSTVLTGLALLGVALAAGAAFVSSKRSPAGRESPSSPVEAPAQSGAMAHLPLAVIVVYSGFVLANLVPTALFNVHDDFWSYLPRSTRMLATGSVGGDPFALVGLDSFGGQAYLQSFAFAILGQGYLNTFDAVVCLILSGALLDAFGRRLGLSAGTRLALMGMLILINPMQVNLSSVYAGAVMCLMAAAAAWALLEADSARDRVGAAALLGLALGAMPVLKMTFLPFAGAFGGLIVLGLAWVSGSIKRAGSSALAVLAAGVVLAVPWLLACLPNSANVLTEGVNEASVSAAAAVGEGLASTFLGNVRDGTVELLEIKRLRWGGGMPLGYGICLAALVAALLLSIFGLFKRTASESNVATLLICIIASVLLAWVAVASVHPAVTALRYLAPLLLVSVPLVGAFACSAVSGSPLRLPTGVLALIGGVILGVFTDSVMLRGKNLVESGTYLAFAARSDRYQSVGRKAFRDRAGPLQLQQRLPEGATVLAWMSTPFHLDFERNKIFTMSRFRAAEGCAGHSGHDALTCILKSSGVQFVIWEYRSPMMKRDNLKSFRDWLLKEAGGSGQVHDDGRTMIVKVP